MVFLNVFLMHTKLFLVSEIYNKYIYVCKRNTISIKNTCILHLQTHLCVDFGLPWHSYILKCIFFSQTGIHPSLRPVPLSNCCYTCQTFTTRQSDMEFSTIFVWDFLKEITSRSWKNVRNITEKQMKRFTLGVLVGIIMHMRATFTLSCQQSNLNEENTAKQARHFTPCNSARYVKI